MLVVYILYDLYDPLLIVVVVVLVVGLSASESIIQYFSEEVSFSRMLVVRSQLDIIHYIFGDEDGI